MGCGRRQKLAKRLRTLGDGLSSSIRNLTGDISKAAETNCFHPTDSQPQINDSS